MMENKLRFCIVMTMERCDGNTMQKGIVKTYTPEPYQVSNCVKIYTSDSLELATPKFPGPRYIYMGVPLPSGHDLYDLA